MWDGIKLEYDMKLENDNNLKTTWSGEELNKRMNVETGKLGVWHQIRIRHEIGKQQKSQKQGDNLNTTWKEASVTEEDMNQNENNGKHEKFMDDYTSFSMA